MAAEERHGQAVLNIVAVIIVSLAVVAAAVGRRRQGVAPCLSHLRTVWRWQPLVARVSLLCCLVSMSVLLAYMEHGNYDEVPMSWHVPLCVREEGNVILCNTIRDPTQCARYGVRYGVQRTSRARRKSHGTCEET